MKTLIVFVLVYFFFPLSCSAFSSEELITDELGTSELVESVPSEVADLFSEYDFLSQSSVEQLILNIKDLLYETMVSELAVVWKPAIQVFMIVIICSIVSAFYPGGNLDFPIMVVGSTAITYLCFAESRSCYLYCVDVVKKAYDFSTVLLPSLAASSIVAGASVSVGVKYTAATLFMNLILNFMNTVLMPFTGAYLVCKIGDCVFQQPILGAVAKVIRWGCVTVLSGVVIIFSAYLNIAGLISGGAELVSTQVTRTVLSNGVPIVGKIISDTASTLVAGASLLRNGIGLFGMLVVISVLLVPIVSVGIRYFLFRFIAEISTIYPDHRFEGLIKGVSDVYGIIFAMTGTVFIILFLSILSFMNLVTV